MLVVEVEGGLVGGAVSDGVPVCVVRDDGVDGARHDFDSDHPVSCVFAVVADTTDASSAVQDVVVDDDFVVVVEGRPFVVCILHHFPQREAHAVHGESRIILVHGDRCRGQPVDKPVEVVALFNHRVDPIGVIGGILDILTQHFARFIPGHADIKRGGLDAVAKQDGAEGLLHIDGAVGGLAKVEAGVVVVVGDERAQVLVFAGEGGGEVVDVEGDLVAGAVVGGGDAGEIEGGGGGGEREEGEEEGEGPKPPTAWRGHCGWRCGGGGRRFRR